MPLGKYYCDYCDKQFQDTPSARRRHIQGIVHQRAKALWYDTLRSSQWADEVQEHPPLGGGVCNRFVQTGSCLYGDSCKYYHPQRNATHVISPVMKGTGSVHNPTSQSPADALHKDASFPVAFLANQMGTSLRNLSPSLWPPPEGGYPPLPFIDWG